jgi:prepilin-type N-terminal cleavage/methylation domain-containing protein
MRRSKKQENGFTLIETMVVLGIMMIMMSFAIFRTTNMLPNYKADGAQDVVVSALRQARQLAITERRDVQVWFDQANTGPDGVQHINYQVIALPGGEAQQALVSVALPKGSQFLVEGGVPDTPMLFGNNAPVYIGSNNAMVSGGPPIMKFRAVGSFTDSAYAPLNGTIFIGVPNSAFTARAVTIIGGTGRVRPYSWTGTAWIE